MPQPASKNSMSAPSSGGGGLFEHACQQCVSQRTGVSHERTARNRRGQRRRTRDAAGWIFSPCRRDGIAQAHLGRLVPPAEGERAAHQRPVAADGTVAAHHEVGPAQFILHLLVALLDPVAQAVQARDRLVVRYQVVNSGKARRSVVMHTARTGLAGP